MHTTHNPAITLPILVDHASWRHLRRLALACAIALLGACGGGGGGGGGGNSDASANSSNSTSVWPFPIGMSIAPPSALADASTVVSGALGVDSIGLNMTATTHQAVVSSQADAVATGRSSLSSNGWLDLNALFDTTAPAHASCYGPAIAYTNHDDAPGTNGSFSAGNVAMWSDADNASTPCAAAELSAQTQGPTAQMHQAAMVMAALRRALATDTTLTMPAAGATTDVTSRAVTLLTPLLGGATVQAASVALDTYSQYTYRLQLSRGSGINAQSLEITVLHTPADSDTRYAGVLRLVLGYLGTDASQGCSDQMSSGRYKVARLMSLGYNRQDQWLSLRLRAGQYCGNPVSTSDRFGELAAVTMSGELDPAVYLSGTVRGSTLGWRQGFVRMLSALYMSTQASDFVYAWQDKPLGGTSHARLFAGHLALDTGTQSRSLAMFHGYTDDITATDGTLRGMVCNWDGPGSTQTLQSAYQYQLMSLGSSATAWGLTTSHIRYAPTNSCNASSGMRFDANGDGSVSGTEGAGLVSELVTPSGGSVDVQDDLLRQGFLSPDLLF